MREVGIRELKSRASRILDEVQEHRAHYAITRRGRPVAMLLPFEHALPPATRELGPFDAWRELERLGEELGRSWTSPLSCGDILSGLRR